MTPEAPAAPPLPAASTDTEPSKKRTRNPIARFVIRLTGLAIVGATLFAGGLGYLYSLHGRPGPLAADTAVVVPRGAATAQIGALLQDAGVIEDGGLFTLGVRLFERRRPLRAGEYAFPPQASNRRAADILQSGETVVRRLTVPEGLTVAEVLALVGGAEGLAGEADGALAEGALLPETYNYSWGDDRGDLVDRMAAAMDAALAELWEGRADELPFDTPEEALVLASIVEKETGIAGERARVAAVFVNRLRRGMRLQSDPTVVYALTEGSGALGRQLIRDDLAVQHPYNTYVHAGLPPGPIANPGRASIAAALDPAVSGDLYFVADGSGGHAFAPTLAQHNRNVARWRRLRRNNAPAAEGDDGN